MNKKLLYHEKLEKRYLYLPKICRIDNVQIGKQLTKNYHLKGKNIFKEINKIDNTNNQRLREIYHIQKDTFPLCLLEKKDIPLKFFQSKNFKPIVKDFVNQNKKNINMVVDYQKYMLDKDNYNLNLFNNSQSLNDIYKLDKKHQKYSFDEELYEVFNQHREKYHKKVSKQNKFGEDILEEMNKLAEPKVVQKKDSLLSNKKNVIDYRKRLAFRFRFTKYLKGSNRNLKKNNSELLTINDNSKEHTPVRRNYITNCNNSANSISNINVISNQANNSVVENNNKSNISKQPTNSNKKNIRNNFIHSKSAVDVKGPKLLFPKIIKNVHKIYNEEKDKLLITGLKYNPENIIRNSTIGEEDIDPLAKIL